MDKFDQALGAIYKRFNDFQPAMDIKSLGTEKVDALKNQDAKVEGLDGKSEVEGLAKRGIVNKPAGTGKPDTEKVDNEANVKGELKKPVEAGEKQPLTAMEAYLKIPGAIKGGDVNKPVGTQKPDMEKN